MMRAPDPDGELLEFIAGFALRPYDFVLAAFPWGEEGRELARRHGPETWQSSLLLHIQSCLLAGNMEPSGVIAEAIQCAVKSGHDIGKSALVCWLIIWAISTREDTKGVVTANTEKQLRLKLWSELAKWHRLFIARQFFRVTATSIVASDPEREKEWRIDAIPWSEDNPEAFAGLHNYGKRVLVIFDEASGIVEKIWETIDGVMNERDTELIWVATGNPTRNVGRFRDCFDPSGQGQFWKTFTVDSREVSFTNHERIQRQIDLYGADSDFIKVRWLGEFPAASSHQLISSEDIAAAMHRPVQSFGFEALILGVDVARFGDNESVLQFRRGRDARTIPVQRLRGLSTTALAQVVGGLIRAHNPDAVFVDGGGVGGGVIDFLRHLGFNPIEVQFGGKPGIPLGGAVAYNKRAEMYLSLAQWLREGGCLPNSTELRDQLIAQEYSNSNIKGKQDAIVLTPKEDMEESPDWSDALALTFAFPVSPNAWRANGPRAKVDYDPLGQEALHAHTRSSWEAPRPNLGPNIGPNGVIH